MDNQPSLDSYYEDLYSEKDEVNNGIEFPEDFDENPEEGNEVDDYTFAGLPGHEDDTELPQHTASDTGEYEEGSSIEPSEVIDELLRAKGIEDPTAVQFENENGQIEEIDFYALPYEEQMAILANEAPLDSQLAPQELQAISFLRDNNVTFEEAIEYYQRKAVQEHIDSQNISGLEVDQYDDTELFTLDLRLKYEDFTDEEIKIQLDKELEHPELFKRKIEKLRTDYREIEQNQLATARSEQEQADAERNQQLEDTLISTAMSVTDIGGLDLDDNDKNQILSYILEKDINGSSAFVKSLNSPQQLFELAWFATKGKEAFNILHDYYKKEIETARRTTVDKGKPQQRSTPAKQSVSTPKSFVRKPQQASNKITLPQRDGNLSIDDLLID